MTVTQQAAAAASRPLVPKRAKAAQMSRTGALAEMEIVERISRVLAGQFFSRNADGAAGDEDASVLVDSNWPDFRDDAIAVLKTLRAPPPALSNENDVAYGGWSFNRRLALMRSNTDGRRLDQRRRGARPDRR